MLQELNTSSHLSLGRCTEPEQNRDWVGREQWVKAFWTTELSMNKSMEPARHRIYLGTCLAREEGFWNNRKGCKWRPDIYYRRQGQCKELASITQATGGQ